MKPKILIEFKEHNGSYTVLMRRMGKPSTTDLSVTAATGLRLFPVAPTAHGEHSHHWKDGWVRYCECGEML